MSAHRGRVRALRADGCRRCGRVRASRTGAAHRGRALMGLHSVDRERGRRGIVADQESKNAWPNLDVGELLKQFQLPGVDVGKLIEGQRENIKALQEANQTALKGWQNLMARQTELMREAFETLAVVARRYREDAAGRAGAEADRTRTESGREGAGEYAGTRRDGDQVAVRSRRHHPQALRSGPEGDSEPLTTFERSGVSIRVDRGDGRRARRRRLRSRRPPHRCRGHRRDSRGVARISRAGAARPTTRSGRAERLCRKARRTRGLSVRAGVAGSPVRRAGHQGTRGRVELRRHLAHRFELPASSRRA